MADPVIASKRRFPVKLTLVAVAVVVAIVGACVVLAATMRPAWLPDSAVSVADSVYRSITGGTPANHEPSTSSSGNTSDDLSETNGRVYNPVCGDAVVAAYNNAYVVDQTTHEVIIAEESIRNVVETFKQDDRYTTDPTCQLILFTEAERSNSYTAAKPIYDVLVALKAEGKVPSLDVHDPSGGVGYKTRLNSLTGSEENDFGSE